MARAVIKFLDDGSVLFWKKFRRFSNHIHRCHRSSTLSTPVQSNDILNGWTIFSWFRKSDNLTNDWHLFLNTPIPCIISNLRMFSIQRSVEPLDIYCGIVAFVGVQNAWAAGATIKYSPTSVYLTMNTSGLCHNTRTGELDRKSMGL